MASGPLFVTVAREDGQAWIPGEARIVVREIAENEDGTARGFELAGVNTVCAEAGGSAVIRRALFLFHKRSISQEAAFTEAGESWFEALGEVGHSKP